MYYFGNTIDKKYIDDNLPKFRQQPLRNEYTSKEDMRALKTSQISAGKRDVYRVRSTKRTKR